jgi:predicted secreted hydrolase
VSGLRPIVWPARRGAPGARAGIAVGALRVAAVALLVAACSGPILANPTLPPSVTARPTPGPSLAPDPQPIAFPRDDGPHARLTEWWYYTGHLRAMDGRRFGFEAVVFRAERGGLPVTWASHLALTDEAGGRFLYGQRSEVGPGADRSPRGADGQPTGFALAITGFDPTVPDSLTRDPWIMAGSSGHDAIRAALSPSEATSAGGGFGLALDLAAEKPPALHGEIGWIDFAGAGSSYYYSRTRMAAAGTLVIDGETLEVAGTAWFDHQWGDFISVGGGGWDWFAVNLADGTDLTISLVRDADGAYPLAYGTLVDRDGRASHLAGGAVVVNPDPARTWTSPATGAVYPAGWTIRVPGEDLVIDLEPTVAAQELDTRPTTGVVYWEGSQVVTARRDGILVAGEAYVELTGYAPPVP